MLRLDGKIPLNSEFMTYPLLYVRHSLIRAHRHNDGAICLHLETSRNMGALCGRRFSLSQPTSRPASVSACQLPSMGHSFLFSATGSLLKPQTSAVGKWAEWGEVPSHNCPRQPSFEQTFPGGNCSFQMFWMNGVLTICTRKSLWSSFPFPLSLCDFSFSQTYSPKTHLLPML